MTVLLIDGNSIGHANNASSRLSVGGIETQAIIGSLATMRDLMVKFDATPICLWDGRAQWRYDLYPAYKAKRQLDPNKTPKPYEIAAQKARESYRVQRPHIVRGLQLLGVRQVIPQDDEADDIAGYLAKDFSAKGKAVVLTSRDHDWLQLVDENVKWHNPVESELVTHHTFAEYTGYEHPHQFVAEKCLVGDSSDNINGVSGIGEKCAQALLAHYGTVEAALAEIQAVGDQWTPPNKELSRFKKKLVNFALDTDGGIGIYERNQKLMSLLNVQKPTSLRVVREPLNEEGFQEFCYEFAFQSILRKYDEWITPFKQ